MSSAEEGPLRLREAWQAEEKEEAVIEKGTVNKRALFAGISQELYTRKEEMGKEGKYLREGNGLIDCLVNQGLHI